MTEHQQERGREHDSGERSHDHDHQHDRGHRDAEWPDGGDAAEAEPEGYRVEDDDDNGADGDG